VVIHNRVGEVAAQRGISTQELSNRADIAYNTALNLVRGVSSRIDLDVLDRVCEVLGAEPGDLLVRVPGDRNQPAGQKVRKP
jgi:putative transcriptional regulator